MPTDWAGPYWDEYRPAQQTNRPPLVLIHGAASSAWIWRAWAETLRDDGWHTFALALRGHAGGRPAPLTEITMDSYRDDVSDAVHRLPAAPVLIGWSMGGLVALMAAADHSETPALILLAPSPPLELQGAGRPEDVAAIPDVFGPETYGIERATQPSKRTLAELTESETSRLTALLENESGAARRQRKRGISIPSERVTCPVLILTGERDRQFPPTSGQRIAGYYRAEHRIIPGTSHLGIVAHEPTARDLARRVSTWLLDHLLV